MHNINFTNKNRFPLDGLKSKRLNSSSCEIFKKFMVRLKAKLCKIINKNVVVC